MRFAIHGLAVMFVAFGTSMSAPAQDRADEKKDGAPLLVAFGASVGGLLFEAHDKIAACELAVGKDGVDIKEIETKLAITTNIMKVLINNLEKARDDKLLGAADRNFVSKAIDTAKLVQEEANTLRKYIGSKDAKDNASYQDYRKKADQEIRVILGIKK